MPASDYRPDAEEVAALVPARTVDGNGRRLGEFTEDTTPTADEVDAYITRALTTVSARVGADIPEEFHELAKGVVALRAAMWVELGGYADQTDPEDQSGYDQLKQMYADDLEALVEVVRGSRDTTASVQSIRTPGPCSDPDDGWGLP